MSGHTRPSPESAGERGRGQRPGAWRRARAPLGIALLVVFLVCRGSWLLSFIEFDLLNAWISSRPPREADPRIAIVAFDQPDVERHRENRPDDCTCGAIPRNELAEILEAVWLGGAEVLVLDLSLEQACPHGRGTADAHDAPLTDALSGPGETVVAIAATPNPGATYFDAPVDRLAGPPERPHILGSPVLYTPGGVVRGVSLIQTGTPSTTAQADASPLELVGITLPPLSLAAWAAWQRCAHEIPVPCGVERVECAGRRIPVWPSASIYLMKSLMPRPERNQHAMLINWVGPVGTFPMYQASAARAAAADGDVETLRRWFTDRIVIVGSGVERLNTPRMGSAAPSRPVFVDQSGEVSMTGLEIHANALQTLLRGRFIQPVETWVSVAVVLLCSVLTALSFRYLRMLPAVAVVAAQLGLLPVVAMLLMRIDIWFYVALPTTALLASGAATAVWGYARSLKRADELAEEVAEREAATATIVHDLKQPLSAISTMAQVLRRHGGHADGDIEPELANRILRQVENALADIDDLLVASPDRDLPLDLQEFDLVALARDLSLAQELKSEVHNLEVIAPAGGMMFRGDPRYLGRVLSNLMDNAIKYWPEGGTIRVEIEEMSGHAVIRVIDRGIGMDEQQQARCFERYRRAVPEGMHIPGTGIGLYSVQRIVEAHGGRVQVVSAPGAGSTFVVTLPLRQPSGRHTAEVRFT